MSKESMVRLPQRADGLANVQQEDFADWYFRVTQRDHLTHLKTKMKKICAKTEIKKRYFHHDEDLIQSNPNFLHRTLPSLDTRQEILATAVPELAAAAVRKAVTEWGRPATDITHLIFCTYSGTHMPGADLRLTSLLGLSPCVERTMLYYNGCSSSCIALRLAKDIAENNCKARVLVACAEISPILFRAPDEDRIDTLVGMTLFGDGGGAVIVGSDRDASTEHPLFEMVSSAQATIPESEHVLASTLSKCRFVYDLSRELPSLIADNIERCLLESLRSIGLRLNWNDLFWVVHPGGRAILDVIQDSLKLEESKLKASRCVLRESGNMSGLTTIFVLDEMLRRWHKGDRDGEHEGRMRVGCHGGVRTRGYR